MLGKLIKDEVKSYRFSFGIIFFTGIIFTIFMKGICMIPYKGEAKSVVQAFAIFGYILILAVMGIAAQVLVVIRFYSTMVGDRGYLTWTLPATSATHIWSKLIGGTLWKTLAIIVMIVLIVIFFAGNYWIWDEELGVGTMDMLLRGLANDIRQNVDATDIILMVLQLISGIVWSAAALLLIYMCIAIGQLFGKWRILASVGIYFAIVIALQIISTIGVVLLALVQRENYEVTYNTTQDVVYSMVSIIIGIAASAGLFAITNYIFKKHLNLD
ncbi:MAG: hypothetical protein K2J90_04705 [Lachnospiraceae bacterium]|nr:hypothetical protein [Lachnospiraceae bacterium]